MEKKYKNQSLSAILVILSATLLLRIFLHSQINVRPTFSLSICSMDIAFFWPIDLVIFLLVIISLFSILVVGRKVK